MESKSDFIFQHSFLQSESDDPGVSDSLPSRGETCRKLIALLHNDKRGYPGGYPLAVAVPHREVDERQNEEA